MLIIQRTYFPLFSKSLSKLTHIFCCGSQKRDTLKELAVILNLRLAYGVVLLEEETYCLHLQGSDNLVSACECTRRHHLHRRLNLYLTWR
jgi:hypothetical protein